MPNKIQHITDQIDNNISTYFYFKDIKFWGLSRLEKHQGKTIPVSYEGNSNYKTVGWNDKYGLNIYHRITSISESKDNEKGFGKNGLLNSVITAKMVVTGNAKKINNNQVDINYKLSDEIVALIPNRLTKATLSALDIYSLGISTSGREMDKHKVYSAEFPDNEEDKIKPSDIIFSIDYQINTKSFDSCQTIACDIDAVEDDIQIQECTNTDEMTYMKGIVAYATGGQANATILTSNYNRVDTVASNNDSCKNNAALAGMLRCVHNTTSNDLALFPAVGESFYGLLANEAVIVVGGSKINLFAYEDGVWTII